MNQQSPDPLMTDLQAVSIPERSLTERASESYVKPRSFSWPRLHGTLLFFHIGKTGGTSLIRHFSSAAKQIYIQSYPDDDIAIDELAYGKSPELIAGHFPIATILPRLPSHWTLATVIRDPHWHLPSSYWHLRTHRSEHVPEGLQQLIAACQTAEFEQILHGAQTEVFQTHFDNPQTRAVLGKKHGPLDNNDLKNAISILSQLDFVGTTECLDDFAFELAAEFHWAAPLLESEVPWIMVNPLNKTHGSMMPESTQQAIRDHTVLDAELYRAADTMQFRRFRRLRHKVLTDVATYRRPSVLPVSDMIRVLPVTSENVLLGHELRISGGDFLLHPPPATEGRSVLTIDDIPLDHHTEISGRLIVAHESAGLVRYTIELSQAEVCHVCAAFVVGPGRPLDIRLQFGPVSGTSRLILSTQMEAAEATNNYAWANFCALTLS